MQWYMAVPEKVYTFDDLILKNVKKIIALGNCKEYL